MDEDKLKLLHDAVSKDYDVGTYQEFKDKLQDPERRKAFYDGVGKEYDLGTFDEFDSKIGGQKKSPIGTTSQDGSSGYAPSGLESTSKKEQNDIVVGITADHFANNPLFSENNPNSTKNKEIYLNHLKAKGFDVQPIVNAEQARAEQKDNPEGYSGIPYYINKAYKYTTNYLTNAGEGILKNAEEFNKSAAQVLTAQKGSELAQGGSGMLAHAAGGVLSGAQVVSPELAAWTLGSDVIKHAAHNDLSPEHAQAVDKVVDFPMQMVSTLGNKIWGEAEQGSTRDNFQQLGNIVAMALTAKAIESAPEKVKDIISAPKNLSELKDMSEKVTKGELPPDVATHIADTTDKVSVDDVIKTANEINTPESKDIADKLETAKQNAIVQNEEAKKQMSPELLALQEQKQKLNEAKVDEFSAPIIEQEKIAVDNKIAEQEKIDDAKVAQEGINKVTDNHLSEVQAGLEKSIENNKGNDAVVELLRGTLDEVKKQREVLQPSPELPKSENNLSETKIEPPTVEQTVADKGGVKTSDVSPVEETTQGDKVEDIVSNIKKSKGNSYYTKVYGENNEPSFQKEDIGKKVQLNHDGDFFSHKRDGYYTISEGKTGARLSFDTTLKGAIEKANEGIDKVGIDKFNSLIQENIDKHGLSPRYEIQKHIDNGTITKSDAEQFITAEPNPEHEKLISDIEREAENATTDEQRQAVIDKADELIKPTTEGQTNAVSENKGEEKPPTVEGTDKNGGEGDSEGSNVGVSHKSLNRLAKQLGLPEIKRGTVLKPEQYADIGRKMLKDGIDPNTVLDSNIDLHEKIAISRAYLEDLIKKADSIKDKTSEEYQDISKQIDGYEKNVVKKLGTDAAKSFIALQGERNLVTDSFFEAERTLKENLGVSELSKEQIEQLQKQTEENKVLKKTVSELEQKLKNAVDKELGDKDFIEKSDKKSTETSRQKRIKKVDKFFDDAIAKISNRGVAYATIIPPDVIKVALKGMKEAYHAGEEIGKIVEDAIKYISDKVKKDWDKEAFRDEYTDALNDIEKKHLTKEEKLLQRKEKELQKLKDGIERKKGKTEYNLSDEEKNKLDDLNNEIKDIKISKIKLDLQNSFYNKKNNVFTPYEAQSLYNYGKEVYLNNGVNWDDMVQYVSSDMGLTPDQVRSAIVTPKAKPISIEKWKAQSELRKNRSATQNYIDNQSQSFLLRQAKKTSGDIRDVATFGHGHIFLGTHAGLTLFSNPQLWTKAYIKGLDLAYKMKPEEVEQFTHDFENNPLWAIANKSGLQNDLHKMGNDMEIASQSHFLDMARSLHKKDNKVAGTAGKVLVAGVEAGQKGFMAIKWLRQQLWEQAYNNLTDEQKGNESVLKSISQLMNNATGATNMKLSGGINDIVKEVSFAGGMEISRWEKILKNPTKAMTTLAKMPLAGKVKWIDELPPQERVFATIWAKRVMTQVLAYGGVVALSKILFPDKNKTGLQTIKNSLGHSEMFKINLPNGNIIDPTSGMVSAISLLGKIYKALPTGATSYKEKNKEEKHTVSDVLGTYGRYKLAPTYQIIAEKTTGKDALGNATPFKNIKGEDANPDYYRHKLTWGEYGESKLPIPLAEGFSSANEAHNIGTGIVNGAISGLFGFKSYNKDK